MAREIQGVRKGEVYGHIPAPVPAQQEDVRWSLEGKRADAAASGRDDYFLRMPQAGPLEHLTKLVA